MANEIQADPRANQAVQPPPVPAGPETQPMELSRPDASKAATSASRRVRARLARRMTSQRSTVNPVLEPLVAQGEVEGQSYGLMYDRLAINEGRPQRYGTQMTCKDGRWVVDTLEDPERVEQWRREMKFPWTLAEYEARFRDYPPCTQQ